ncbi:MAG: endonuclease/exonuclease/phosphatase family protein, partial [Bacteroidales bacterium]
LYSLLLLLFCVGHINCKKETPDEQVYSILLSDEKGDPVKDAFIITNEVKANRWVKGTESKTSEDGKAVVSGGRDLYATVYAADYEPEKIKLNSAVTEIVLRKKNTLSILSYNVLEGFKAADSFKVKQFREWIKKYNPDIILFQEMNKFTDSSLEEFASSYGHGYSVLLKTTGYPTAVTSKFPISNIQKILDGQTHGFISCKIKDLNIFCCHLSPRQLETRQKEIQQIVTRATSWLLPGSKALIAGDLNSYNAYDEQAYGAGFKNERKKYNPNTPVDYSVTNTLLDKKFIDAYTLFSEGVFKATIPVTADPAFPNKGCRYDYIFMNEELAPACTFSDVLRERVTDELSDHYPVYVRLKL